MLTFSISLTDLFFLDRPLYIGLYSLTYSIGAWRRIFAFFLSLLFFLLNDYAVMQSLKMLSIHFKATVLHH